MPPKIKSILFIGLLAIVIGCEVLSFHQSDQDRKYAASIQPSGSDPQIEPAHVPERYEPLWQPGLTDADVVFLRANLPYDSISLERTPCYGSCPAYVVIFHRDGEADLDAKSDLPKLGKFKGKIDMYNYGRLCYLIENSHFENMQSTYLSYAIDLPSCIVTVTKASKVTQVFDYGGAGPIELWAIQELIDEKQQHIDWKPAP